MSASMSKAERRAAFNARIAASWDAHNDDEISTEQLLDRVSRECGCDVSRVIDGMVEQGLFQPAGAQS
jgi:alkylhydroperoxidase family enzyme